MWAKPLYLYKNGFTIHRSLSHLCKARLPLRTSRNIVCFNYLNSASSHFHSNRNLHHSKLKVKQLTQQDCNSFTCRTHTCGDLRSEHVGQDVTLCGWVQFVRYSKFLLLRDAYGLTQCLLIENDSSMSDIPLETVVKIEGTVIMRPKDMVNESMATGEVEVKVKNLEVLNTVDKLPFNLRNYQKPKEQLRMQYRYIDLRFPEMQSILRQRSQMLHNMRRFLIEKYGFIEVETPTLFCRTPGGAREFVVPTHHSGLFYSLVQSPQQFKQMLMAGGVDRYFQIARCYRDETTRPDRQPEFTQLDIELSFTNLDGVLTMIEELLFETYLKPLPKPPFKRMTYKYALENYGTDKPNLAFDLKLVNVKHLFLERDDTVFALPYPSEMGKLSTKYKENIRDIMKKYSTKVVLNENLQKEFGTEILEKIKTEFGHNKNIIISVGDHKDVCSTLGDIRLILAQLLQSKNLLTISETVDPFWIIDFPLFEKTDEGLAPCHHPFTAPHPEDIHLLDKDPLKVRSLAYDLVMDGNEIGGGSVRIHNVELQEKLLGMLQIDGSKLAHFLNALKSGCPPHAGIALGIDRIMSILCKTESIRDVIAFPKSHDGRDPLSGAPNVISDDDKKYYHINTDE